jgi:hypothetical protein
MRTNPGPRIPLRYIQTTLLTNASMQDLTPSCASTFRSAYSETLNIRGKQTVRNPTAGDIRRAVKSISTTDANPFVVLGKGASGLTYIQAALEADSEWTVEYQDGHLDQHFRTLENLRTEEVVRLFISYAEAEESWREAADWELVEV